MASITWRVVAMVGGYTIVAVEADDFVRAHAYVLDATGRRRGTFETVRQAQTAAAALAEESPS